MKLSSIAPLAIALTATAQASYINYTTVTGYFLQDEASTDASTFDYTTTNFGLINRTYPSDNPNNDNNLLTQWERFHHHITTLNHLSPPTISYKVLFLGRHGEGYHNAAESYYGTPAWNCYYSLLTGNSTTTWSDADLTPSGIQQAQIAHSFWSHQIASQRIHTPDTYFVSPLLRALRTANITFSDLPLQPSSSPFTPVIKEFFRESVTLHTCDHRHNATYIHSLFPEWTFEKGFSEEDGMWDGVRAESNAAQDVRSKVALDEVFAGDDDDDGVGMFVSVTSHSGEIASLLRVMGHREFGLRTGAVLPVLVRGEIVGDALEPTGTGTRWETSAHCTAPPVTSVSSGCVCASSAVPVTTPLVTFAG
ncbi:GPI anchored protein [Aspergillus piperis CBS 112811]|uniref:GPI anchored protein n=1 Tax=Aspergillus piperis CBS 112811 TaxID=1448313 RepID=A0A8G1VPH5_9EURO|nr:GPI anchored protein [Aspergillus piperis CBS 112811]RAH60994.1 GPI anchored protein [Aspergillus piperis CBS 112811]